MAKPWHERELWEKVYTGPHGNTYIAVGRIIAHRVLGAFEFWDLAKLEPGYDKLRFDDALRDLTVWEKRERGSYELLPRAKKVLRIIIGPAPDDAEYGPWWKSRLVSVAKMRDEGQEVRWADNPPVPLPGDEQVQKAPKPRKKRARK